MSHTAKDPSNDGKPGHNPAGYHTFSLYSEGRQSFTGGDGANAFAFDFEIESFAVEDWNTTTLSEQYTKALYYFNMFQYFRCESVEVTWRPRFDKVQLQAGQVTPSNVASGDIQAQGNAWIIHETDINDLDFLSGSFTISDAAAGNRFTQMMKMPGVQRWDTNTSHTYKFTPAVLKIIQTTDQAGVVEFINETEKVHWYTTKGEDPANLGTIILNTTLEFLGIKICCYFPHNAVIGTNTQQFGTIAYKMNLAFKTMDERPIQAGPALFDVNGNPFYTDEDTDDRGPQKRRRNRTVIMAQYTRVPYPPPGNKRKVKFIEPSNQEDIDIMDVTPTLQATHSSHIPPSSAPRKTASQVAREIHQAKLQAASLYPEDVEESPLRQGKQLARKSALRQDQAQKPSSPVRQPQGDPKLATSSMPSVAGRAVRESFPQ